MTAGLRSLSLKNFKAYKDLQTIEFSPITLLFGPNSGGKSSIFDALEYLNDIFSGRMYRGDEDARMRFLSLIHVCDPTLDMELSVSVKQFLKTPSDCSTVRHSVIIQLNEKRDIPVVKDYTVTIDGEWFMKWRLLNLYPREVELFLEEFDLPDSLDYGLRYTVIFNPAHPLWPEDNQWKAVHPFYGEKGEIDAVLRGAAYPGESAFWPTDIYFDLQKSFEPSFFSGATTGIYGDNGFVIVHYPGVNLLSFYEKLVHGTRLMRRVRPRLRRVRPRSDGIDQVLKRAFLGKIYDNASTGKVVAFPLQSSKVYESWKARAILAAGEIKDELDSAILRSLPMLHLGPLRKITEGHPVNILHDEERLIAISDIGADDWRHGVGAWNWFQTLAKYKEVNAQSSLNQEPISSMEKKLKFKDPGLIIDPMLEDIRHMLHERLNIEYELRLRREWRVDVDHVQSWLKDKTESTPIASLLEQIGQSESLSRVQLWDSSRNIRVHPKQVGTGIVQILPVLMMLTIHQDSRLIVERVGLFSDPLVRERLVHTDSIALLIEQPELHLHPAQQTRLGDVFIESKGKGDLFAPLIIETHSEHLLLRLLRRIRETTHNMHPDEKLALCTDDLSVNYIFQPRDHAIIKCLRVDGEGEFIDRWPEGFFDERIEELF
ncbi:AAA family ATPase [Thiolapillus sp.]